MPYQIPFLKAQGLGNDFMIVDLETLPKTECDWHLMARTLSDRRLGIGFDQLLLFKEHHVWFYNADGSFAETCGNGTRCLAYHLMKKKHIRSIDIQTPAGPVHCILNPDDSVTVQMPSPSVIEEKSLVAQADLFKHFPIYVRIGNPHLVCFVDNLDDLHEYGPILARQDVNVGFVKLQDFNTLTLKVWERGTGLTPACGSGACASVIAAQHHQLVGEKVIVSQEGGDLIIEYKDHIVLMTGKAQIVFEGRISRSSWGS